MTGHQGQHAQRNQGRNSGRGVSGRRGRKEPRSFDRDTHHRIDSRRFRDGREDVRFEGYWFSCDFWPGWIYTEDVYFVMGPDNVWFVHQYGDPAFIIQVVLVD